MDQERHRQAIMRDTRRLLLVCVTWAGTALHGADTFYLGASNGLSAAAVAVAPVGIHESRTQFSMEWNVRYEITGEVFIVCENDGGVRSSIGYPTEKILELSSGI